MADRRTVTASARVSPAELADCLEIGLGGSWQWNPLDDPVLDTCRNRTSPYNLPVGCGAGGWPVDDAVVTERMDLAYQVTA